MSAWYFKITPLFHLLPNWCFSFEFGVAQNKAANQFLLMVMPSGPFEVQTQYQWWKLFCVSSQRGSSLRGNYRYKPWMSGTCHNWFTFESGFFNNMPLGATSPAAVWKGAVMRTSPDGTLKDLQCRRSSLANNGVAYLRICVNQHYICSAPLSHLLSVFAAPRREQL